MESEQIVVIDTDYGAQVYWNGVTPIVYLDLKKWSDQTPTRAELNQIKEQTKRITHIEALRFMAGWIDDNEEYIVDLERPNDLEIQNAKELLKQNGYEVTP